MDILLAVIIIFAVVLFFWRRRQRGTQGSRIEELKKEYRQQLNMSLDKAEPIIQRQLGRLKEKHPDKPEEWYYEKMLHDLKRDRS